MDSGISIRNKVDLELMLLDRSAKPTYLPLSLLEDITNCFSDDRQIGSGGFAVVYKGILGKRLVAVKKLSITFDMHEIKFHREVECLMKAKHKNIVHFLGYCSETHGRTVDYDGKFVMADIRNWLLCFEYVPNGSLDKYITDASCGLEWRLRYDIIRGICEGLFHLHEKRILHLDLKPSNILLDDHMVPKIADFGLSRFLDKEQTQAFTSNRCGSLGYLAPEFFGGQVAFSSDIYSLGVIIVEMLTGEKGYPEDENVIENWMGRLEGSDQWDTQLEQVRVCTKIGIECMDLDPKKRPVVRHIIDRLEKMTSTIETSIAGSSIEQQVSVLMEQYYQGKTAKLASKYPGKDKGEQAEREELVEFVEKPREEHRQQGREEALGDECSFWGAQDTKQNVIPEDASLSGTNHGLLYRLKNLNIFTRKARRKNLRNGGPTLDSLQNFKLFQEWELKIFFKSSNIIFKDGFGEVYRGFVDNVPFTLRKLIGADVPDKDYCVNEISIQSRVLHKNILRLIGCYLESENPILVYEFSEGNLQDLLHSYNKVPLNLGARLSIAAASAAGLAYMHSVADKGIFHGDFQPANILFNDNFEPKIYFGMSRMTSKDIVGNMAYMDPVWLQTGMLTKRSDVYSFGVVILELITRKEATHFFLVKNFLENHRRGKKSTELFDEEIAVTGELELLDNLAELAVECLDLDVDRRPTMMDVAERLSRLNKSRELALLQAGTHTGFTNADDTTPFYADWFDEINVISVKQHPETAILETVEASVMQQPETVMVEGLEASVMQQPETAMLGIVDADSLLLCWY